MVLLWPNLVFKFSIRRIINSRAPWLKAIGQLQWYGKANTVMTGVGACKPCIITHTHTNRTMYGICRISAMLGRDCCRVDCKTRKSIAQQTYDLLYWNSHPGKLMSGFVYFYLWKLQHALSQWKNLQLGTISPNTLFTALPLLGQYFIS